MEQQPGGRRLHAISLGSSNPAASVRPICAIEIWMGGRPRFGAKVLRAMTSALIAFGGSCGAVVGQIPFSQEGAGEVTFQAQAGEVHFWTDFSAQYHGDMVAYFAVQLVQNDQVVSYAVCDPVHLGPSRICTTRYWGVEEHEQHCRMACSGNVPRSGPTVVRARLWIPGRPVDLRLGQANLVVRQ
jgi:hypothetical protein